MNMLIMGSTKKIQLETIDAEVDLVETMKKYANGINYVSSVIFDNGRIIPARKLQLMVYAYLRESIGLKFQMSYNIPKQVAGTYKTIIELVKIGMRYW